MRELALRSNVVFFYLLRYSSAHFATNLYTKGFFRDFTKEFRRMGVAS